MLYEVITGLGFDHGAFTDTVGIVLWAFERAGGVWAGERVVVVGPGALGLLAVQIARAGGAREVIAVGAANDARITSYNVCYTKLLRFEIFRFYR